MLNGGARKAAQKPMTFKRRSCTSEKLYYETKYIDIVRNWWYPYMYLVNYIMRAVFSNLNDKSSFYKFFLK